MDFKSLLSSLDQLSEATEKTKTGLKHTAEPGGYGRKDDEDEEGNKVKSDAPKRGRGRPKKDADSSGEVKKYDFSAFGASGKDVKLPKWDKSKTTKHSLKEYFDDLDKALNEAEQVTIQPAQQNAQVIKQGTKTLGTVTNPQLAAQIKQSIGKGEMSLAGDELGEDGDYSAKRAAAGKDIGKPGKNFAKIEKSAGGGEKGKRIAGAVLAKLRAKTNEAERPTDDSTMGGGLGAGRSQGVLEAKKPDANNNGIPDYAEDGKGKNDLKKKKVKEGVSQNLQAARLAGKSHGLKGHSHCGKNYEDMEEARMYHEGYKEGLDECYGMGMALEDVIPATVPGMANQAMEAEIEEMDKSDWMQHKAKSTPGDTFSAFGQTFKDKEVVESPFAFEAWENQLSSLLEGKEPVVQVNEGMTVSISKGQQGAPDSVSVSAQDAEADQLLSLIKSAGLGLFGGDDAGQAQHSANPMTVDTTDPAEIGTGGVAIDVVDDHDGMMSLIKKVAGAAPKGPEGGFSGHHDEEGQDYEEEGSHDHEHTNEGTCNECGMMECGCDTMEEGEEEIGGPSDESEEEYIDQSEEEVAEEINPNNDDEAQEEQSDATRDAALAQAADDNEKQVDEGEYANSDDDQFAADIDFMTNVISGGLNKQKSTGQTTVPVIAGQEDRMTTTESIVADWKKLAGIK